MLRSNLCLKCIHKYKHCQGRILLNIIEAGRAMSELNTEFLLNDNKSLKKRKLKYV